MPCLSIPARLPGSNSSWTPERIEALTRLWNDSEAVIADLDREAAQAGRERDK